MNQGSHHQFTGQIRQGAALSHPATQAALARYRQRCRQVIVPAVPAAGIGAVALVVALVVGSGQDDPLSGGALVAGTIGALLLIAGITLSVVGRSRLQVAARMERTLASHPWVTRTGYQLERRMHWSSPPALVLHDEQFGVTTKHNIHTGIDNGRVFVTNLYQQVGHPLPIAGDIRQEAVLATPDMSELATLKPYSRWA